MFARRRLLRNQNKIMFKLIITLSKLELLLIIIYMEERGKLIIFKETIILLNLFLVYIFFVESLYVLKI